jgi:putative endonuclease
MSYFVYVLRNKINSELYKGITNNLQRRISEHNQGKHKYTSQFLPWEIAYSEEFETLKEARSRELFLKSGSGREFLKRKLISI